MRPFRENEIRLQQIVTFAISGARFLCKCEKLKEVMISVSNISMRYGSKILFEDVSTTFTAGRRYGLTGPNGAGKTTFMKILSGRSGAAERRGCPPRKSWASSARISMPSMHIE